ncbi:ArsA family ATPase [Candidatus Bathyarchaeota archaeon]|nr:ArsA family ATPase [Candidatus Bathyarchaeota archaeon]
MTKEHITFSKFIEQHPNIKFMFTGGKGGVGKTIAAAGIAYYFASQGEKVLLASLNPVHSLSSLFQQDLTGGVVKPVKGAKNLYAIEVDITERKEKYKAQLAEKLRMFLKWADISMKADEFVDIASTNPAFEESAMFDETMEIMLNKSEEYDRVVFDTAAVANAVRLLGLSKIYGLWLSRMIKSRKEALSLRVKLSFRKDRVQEEVKKDPLIADLLEMNERIKKAKKIFNDPERTAFFFVTLPLALPIAVVKRFISMVQGFNIPTGGVIVNQVIPEELVKGKKVSEYMINKYKEQQAYLEIIRRDLWPMVRAIIPLYETEILGVDMVAKVAENLISWQP